MFTINAVYHVIDSSEQIKNPIAIRPQLINGNRVEWNDTNRGKAVPYISVIFDNMTELEVKEGKVPSIITLNRESGKLTLEILTKKVFDNLMRNNEVAYVEGQNPFASDDEVQKHFLTTRF